MFLDKIHELGIQEIILQAKPKEDKFLPEEWLINALEESDQFKSLSEQLWEEQIKDPLVNDLMKTKASELEQIKGWHYRQDELWRFHNKIYIPLSLR